MYSDLLPKPKRTSLAHSGSGSPGVSRPSTPTPRKSVTTSAAAVASAKKSSSKAQKDHSTPLKQEPIRTPAKRTPGSAKKATLAASVSKALPTPGSSRKRPRADSPDTERLDIDKSIKGKGRAKVFEDVNFDETFGIRRSTAKADEESLRETFLANEKLRKQREARNFEYEGDANAPKLTRSGKIVGGELDLDEDEDMEEPQEEDLQIGEDFAMDGMDLPMSMQSVDRSDMEANPVYIDTLPMPEETRRDDSQIEPLLPEAKGYVLDILDTLTGRQTSLNPPSFPEEEKNEALNGIVNLLRGTVERGEGNSALLVGARGVGKSRVSHLLSSLSA